MRGGRREGAGRKRGSANAKTREIADQAALQGVTPLEYMLRIMRDDEAEAGRRDEMAKSAAPYMHPRLNSVDHGVKNETLDKLTALVTQVMKGGKGASGLLKKA